MNNQFTQTELQAIKQLILRTQITGNESLGVAQLIQKINVMLEPQPGTAKPEDKPKKDGKGI